MRITENTSIVCIDVETCRCVKLVIWVGVATVAGMTSMPSIVSFFDCKARIATVKEIYDMLDKIAFSSPVVRTSLCVTVYVSVRVRISSSAVLGYKAIISDFKAFISQPWCVDLILQTFKKCFACEIHFTNLVLIKVYKIIDLMWLGPATLAFTDVDIVARLTNTVIACQVVHYGSREVCSFQSFEV